VNASALLKQVPTAIVIPGTSKRAGARFPHTVSVMPTALNGLTEQTIFLCFQVQAVDQGWITAKKFGALSADDLEKVEEALLDAIGYDT
jgi:mRNA-degrading endonuclease toxin of MazEF toxin-antitoxin module